MRQERFLDPETGKQSVRNVEKEESMDAPSGLRALFGSGSTGGPSLFGFLRDVRAMTKELER